MPIAPLEHTHESYALAKIAAIKLCESYRTSALLRLHLSHAHEPLRAQPEYRSRVQPCATGVARKFHEAKLDGERKVTILGVGPPHARPYADVSGPISSFRRMFDKLVAPPLLGIEAWFQANGMTVKSQDRYFALQQAPLSGASHMMHAGPRGRAAHAVVAAAARSEGVVRTRP